MSWLLIGFSTGWLVAKGSAATWSQSADALKVGGYCDCSTYWMPEANKPWLALMAPFTGWRASIDIESFEIEFDRAKSQAWCA